MEFVVRNMENRSIISVLPDNLTFSLHNSLDEVDSGKKCKMYLITIVLPGVEGSKLRKYRDPHSNDNCSTSESIDDCANIAVKTAPAEALELCRNCAMAVGKNEAGVRVYIQ